MGGTLPLINAMQVVRQVLQIIGVPHRQNGEDEFLLTTEWGARPRLFIAPDGEEVFKRRHPRMRRMDTSQYLVVLEPHQRPFLETQGIVDHFLDGLRRGYESERIAGEALKKARSMKPSLFVDFFKTGDVSDIAGADFRIGMPDPRRTGGVFWIGLQIKSSVLAAENAVKKWRTESRNREGYNGIDGLRRVIVVPQEGTENERIAETARRIIKEVEAVRESLQTGRRISSRDWSSRLT